MAYTGQKMTQFSGIANDCAMATNRQQLDKPAKEFGEFLGSFSKDGVLALVGLAGGMTAPRVMPRVEEALSNNVGNVKQILKEGLPKLDEPRLATPNGAPVQTTNIKPTNGKTTIEKMQEPLEMRAGKSTAGNRRFEETMRQKHLPEGTVKVVSGDELTQAVKITNRPAADQIAFVQKGKNVEAVITEITQGNKGLTHLTKQLEGGRMIAQSDKELGDRVVKFTYRVITNNQKLINEIKADTNFQNKFKGRLEIVPEGGKR